MERNVDKIKRLEHELGRWHKKVADTAKENEKLREALAQADAGNKEMREKYEIHARRGEDGKYILGVMERRSDL